MPAIPHVIRRGGAYYWRRRLPRPLANSANRAIITLRLGTRDPRRARFLSAQITAAADLLIAWAIRAHMTPSQTQGLFLAVFGPHLDKLDRVVDRERADADFDPEDSRRGDLCFGWAYRLLETRGLAADIDERAQRQMRDAGMSADAIADVGAILKNLKSHRLVPDRPARLEALLGTVGAEPNPMNIAQAQSIVYRAMAAACFEDARRYDGQRHEKRVIVEEFLENRARSSDITFAKAPFASPPCPLHSEPALSATAIPDVAQPEVDCHLPTERSQEDQASVSMSEEAATPSQKLALAPLLDAFFLTKKGIWSAKTQSQARQTILLFERVLRWQHVMSLRQLAQRHVANFVTVLDKLPVRYGKSCKDWDLSIPELLKKAEGGPSKEVGLSATTINRHLTFLQTFIKHLIAQGDELPNKIDINALRRPTGGIRGRDKGTFFSEDDLRSIAKSPIFTGCAGRQRKQRAQPGDIVYHGGAYFATLMIIYSGCRREEVCALTTSDIVSVGSKDFGTLHIFRVRSNENRGLKNPFSVRDVPLHPEILRLGFLEYVAALRKLGLKDLFPDLKRPSESTSMGDVLYKDLQAVLLQAIDKEKHKAMIHGFRRTFGSTLKKAGAHAEERGDLLGHAGRNATEEEYAEELDLDAKYRWTLNLPEFTSEIECAPLCLDPLILNPVRPRAPRRRKEHDET